MELHDFVFHEVYGDKVFRVMAINGTKVEAHSHPDYTFVVTDSIDQFSPEAHSHPDYTFVATNSIDRFSQRIDTPPDESGGF
jgi:hypothetical protein